MTTQIIIGGYLFFVLLGIVIWLISKRPTSPLANVGSMIDRIMHHRTTRVAIMLAWWWVGWHFLVNVVHR